MAARASKIVNGTTWVKIESFTAKSGSWGATTSNIVGKWCAIVK